jgi:thiol-disulfide isomerase/thioredoxin
MSESAAQLPEIVILDFWGTGCGTCRLIAPVVARVVAAQDKVSLRMVNVEEEPSHAEAMSVRTLPTLIFTGSDGREVGRLTGAMTGSRIEAALAEARASLGGS